MIFIHGGTYHWKPRRIAFRADYCRACDASRISVLIRTVDVLHLFWIPVLPIGIWSRWFCSSCGHRPHQATRTRRGFIVAGAIILALVSTAVWVPWNEAVPLLVWMLRFVLPLFTLLVIRAAWRWPTEPDYQARLAQVAEFQGWVCPLCGGQLLQLPELRCTQCHAEHRPLPHRQCEAS